MNRSLHPKQQPSFLHPFITSIFRITKAMFDLVSMKRSISFSEDQVNGEGDVDGGKMKKKIGEDLVPDTEILGEEDPENSDMAGNLIIISTVTLTIRIRSRTTHTKWNLWGLQETEQVNDEKLFVLKLEETGRGVLVYLRGHEGRGIGLGHKLRAYNLIRQIGNHEAFRLEF
ncbi:hypothetical protein LXL04_021396 [Taraxacum kok-saghyz]